VTDSTWGFEWHRLPLKTYATTSDSTQLLTMSVRVTNTGETDSAIVVPAFLRVESLHANAFGGSANVIVTPPVRELFDFRRVFCAAKDSVVVEVELGESVLALSDKAGVLAVRPGKYTVIVGGHPGKKQEAATASIVVEGPPRIVLSLKELRSKVASEGLAH
jgi:hypothetical protein